MSPYLVTGVVAAWAASTVATGLWCYGAGQDAEVATQARETKVEARATAAAATAAASAIANLKVVHTTVRQELEREVVEKPVFRDCRSGMDAVRMFNSTFPGAPATSGAGDRGVPAADAASR